MPLYNVEKILDRLGISYEVKGNEAFAPCPLHKRRTGHEDRNPSWSVNLDTGLHFCFSCHYRGGLVRLVRDLHGPSLTEAEAESWIGDDFDPEYLTKVLNRTTSLSPRPRPQEAEFLALDDPTDEALASRCLTRESAALYQVKHDGRNWYFPFRDMLGTYHGYQRKEPDRVRNLPYGVNKKQFLFGEHLVATQLPVVVVESPLDAVLSHGCGHQAVAMYGSYPSETQVNTLSSHPLVILALDNDNAGQHGTDFLYAGLRTLTVVKQVIWPDGIKDFGDAPDRVNELIRGSKDPLQIELENYA